MITQSTRTLTNDERIELWRFAREVQTLQTRSGTGRASSTADHSRSFIGRAFYYLASLIGLAAWFAGIFAATYIIGALMEPVEPETRCFTNAIGETYCRDQFVWEVE